MKNINEYTLFPLVMYLGMRQKMQSKVTTSSKDNPIISSTRDNDAEQSYNV